jgi:aryl-alcohol dehydrogenase-like predicted oxidoreductase
MALLGKEAEARNTTIDAVALAGALAQPWVDVALSGAVTVEQLDSNLRALTLAQETADWPDIAEASADYWAKRSALAWQ